MKKVKYKTMKAWGRVKVYLNLFLMSHYGGK
jgi:hypothetical protein